MCSMSQKCPECVNLVDPAGGAHDAPPDPLVSWGGDTPLQTPPSSVPGGARPCGLHFCSRLLSGPPLSISYTPLMYGLMNGTNTNDRGISSWDLNFTVESEGLFKVTQSHTPLMRKCVRNDARKRCCNKRPLTGGETACLLAAVAVTLNVIEGHSFIARFLNHICALVDRPPLVYRLMFCSCTFFILIF